MTESEKNQRNRERREKKRESERVYSVHVYRGRCSEIRRGRVRGRD